MNKDPIQLSLSILFSLLLLTCDNSVVGTSTCDENTILNEQTGLCEPTGTDTDSPPDGIITDHQSDQTSENSEDIPVDTYQPDPWEDDDSDGIPNQFDNCPLLLNFDQSDMDGDGIGDLCDNCSDTSNSDQLDSNNDGTGNACEEGEYYDSTQDADTDGIFDIQDNCPDVINGDQQDQDSDHLGDACDNCPLIANYDQHDTNQDMVGDACEILPAGEICGTQQTEFQRLKPNIYIVIDRSTSMKHTDGTELRRMVRAKQGLDRIAEELHEEIRVGLSTYPCARQGDPCHTLNKELLPIGEYSDAEIKASYGVNYTEDTCPHGSETGLEGLDIEIGGKHCTETSAALEDVLNQNRVSDDTDPQDDMRNKSVVLVTDGGACGCGAQPATVAGAQALFNAGIPVYVVGFNFEDERLEQVATAGGTDAPGPNRYFNASNADELVTALRDIYELTISCSFELSPPPADADKIWIAVEGLNIIEDNIDGFSYDRTTNTLTLHGQACTALQNSDPDNPPLTVQMGCATECIPEGPEICDFRDNNCDGIIDDDCGGCLPEICDGIDNDCDGELDEGCPECALNAAACLYDNDCCDGECIGGFCARPCYPLDVACSSDADCCEGTCIQQGSNQRTCNAQ